MRPRKSLPQTLHREKRWETRKGAEVEGRGLSFPLSPSHVGGRLGNLGFGWVPSPPLDPRAGGGGRVAHSAGEGTLRAIAVPFLLQRSGFGWFSWFRSKPPNKAAPSGDEDSPDSPDSEVA